MSKPVVLEKAERNPRTMFVSEQSLFLCQLNFTEIVRLPQG